MLRLLDRHFAEHSQARPWTIPLGVARSLIALGALLTVAANSRGDLFPVAGDLTEGGRCTGLSVISAFCQLEVGAARLTLLAILAVSVSGFAPRLFIVPQWYAHFSIARTIGPAEGGDHIAVIVTLLMVPIFLTDRRLWHWQAPKPAPDYQAYIASVAFRVLQIQVAIVYLHASLGKLAVTEWVDGTATYYWLLDETFGVAQWLEPVMTAIAHNAIGVGLLTWGTIAVEFLLALGLFASRRQRMGLLVLGIGLHVSIGIGMGLVSFSLVMAGTLIAYLCADLTVHLEWMRGLADKRPHREPPSAFPEACPAMEGADVHA